MSTTIGTARRIDSLGRVVVPVEMRRMLGIDVGDLLDIHVEAGRIVMSRIEHSCLFCGSNEQLRQFRERLVCAECVAAIGTAEPTP
jgi:transcriptional pleiotropic regulator of transition state genes